MLERFCNKTFKLFEILLFLIFSKIHIMLRTDIA